MWLPGYERHEYPGLAGKSFQFTHNPKGCMHTTEGGSIAGAMSAYAPYPPHLIYDWRNRRGVQHVRLDRASYSAMDGNDDDYLIQVELVGFAAETRNWPEEALRNIAADVVAPLEQYFKIPRRIIWHGFKDSRDGVYPYISSAESPIRLNWTQLRDFSGWLGHQHLPAPDNHWDPGALPMQRILSYLSEDEMNADQEKKLDWAIALAQETRNRTASMHTKGFLEVRSDEPRAMGGDLGWFQSQMRVALAPVLSALAAATNDPDITADQIRQIVDDATTKASREQATLVTASIKADLVPLIDDALGRVQDADNADEARRTAIEFFNIIKGVAVPSAPETI